MRLIFSVRFLLPKLLPTLAALLLVMTGSRAAADIATDPTANANAPAPTPRNASDDAVFGMTAEEQAFLRPFLQQVQGAMADAQEQQATSVRKQGMLRKLRSMQVDKIDFQEAGVSEVLKSIENLTVALDPEKKGINFIIAPEALAQRKDVKISLKLANVPLSEVLKYTLNMADLAMRVDDYAILIALPKKGDAGAQPPPPTAIP